MKRLLCGVAFAALIAAPVWAQTPSDNQNNPSNPNAGKPPATAQAPAQNAPSVSLHMPIGQLPALDLVQLLAHTKTLSSDEFEGRA